MKIKFKRLIVVIGILISLFLPCIIISQQGEESYAMAEVNDFWGYRKELAYINEHYTYNYECRIIVKSYRKLEDKNCIEQASGFAGLNVFQYNTKVEAQTALEYFSSCKYVEYAFIDSEITIDDIEAVNSDYSDLENLNHLTWGADLLGVDAYQQEIIKKYNNSVENLPEIYVAVIDTGIDTDNEFLAGRIAYEFGVSYYESEHYSNGESSYPFEDDNSHGTHVAGTIVDLTLDNVKIIPVKVLNAEGSGSTINVVSGMEYVVSLKQKGTNVVAYNMSLGGYGVNEDEQNAVNSAYENNIMPVVAAGNDNYYVEDCSPANCENALTISALSQNEYYENFPYIAYYSNYGSYVDLCLPGTNILSCVPDDSTYEKIYTSATGGKYAVISGTSMATPHATGLVALYATYYGEAYDVQTVEQAIKSNTYDFGDVGRDDEYGDGIPSMALALGNEENEFNPTLNYGEVNDTYKFNEKLDVTINSNYKGKYTAKIYYSLDGSFPTLISYKEYIQPIEINDSAFLRFVIYIFDSDGIIRGHSAIYEVEYLKNTSNCNDTGVGFEINSFGMLTKYTSGLKNIVIPEYVNGVKVKGLAENLFYGLNIESVVAENDLTIGYYPFVCCGSLKSIKLNSTVAEYVAQYCFGLKELYLPQVSELREAFLASSTMYGFYGSYTFKGCFNLEKIYAPNVCSIKYATFSGFKKLKEISISWDNLNFIDEYAFEDCVAFKKDIVLNENIKSIGEFAFDGSGITSFIGLGLQQLYEYTLFGCKNLKFVELPKIKSIYDNAFTNSSNLDYLFLGDNELELYKDSLSISSSHRCTIYCYDVDFISQYKGYNNFVFADISTYLQEKTDENICVEVSGYNVVIKVFASNNDILDDEDILVDETNFLGLNLNKNYYFTNFLEGRFYYIIQAVDEYGNIFTTNILRSSTKQAYTILIDSNIQNHGLQISPLSYYQNDEVKIILNDTIGYKLNYILLDERNITNDFINGFYTFSMPNRNVIITINYTPIKYYIKNIINGDGAIAIRNALQSEITEACYGDQIFVYHTAQNSTYLKELYYLDEQAQKTNLPIAENFSSFTMPNKNITIHAIFEVPNLSNFYVSKDYGNRTFILKSYSGNEANIIIPQYYVEKGISYRFAGLGDLCFYNTPTLESIKVEFIDENKNGITVGENAFGKCFNLKKLEIGNIVSIAKGAFQDCYNLFNLDLSNCKVVGKSSLSNCKKIVNADLSSCIELEEQAFDSCQNLTNVLLSGEIKIIKSRTFIDCKNLKSINLENVASIGQYAFWGCESLQSIDISNCSTFEGDNNTFNNFYGCSSLIEVLNPKKLKVIPKDAFGNCKNLKLFDFSYCDTICTFAFYNCAFEIVDLSNVKKVEENAFIGCEKLEDCILGSNENLINGSSFGASYIRYIYIDKDYDGPFGQFITDKYTYVYDDVKNPNFKIYCTLPLNLITFQFDDGRIIDKSYYKGGSDVVVPTTFSDETYNYTFTNWKRYGYNDVLNPEDFKNIWADRKFVANDYSTTYVEYIIKFYYGYDYDSSGIIGDEGDIFKQITGRHYNQQIELPTPNPTRPSDIQHDFNFHTWQHNGEDVSNLVCTGDMAIVATYNATIRKYLISWYDATGNLIYSENLEYGTMPTFNSDDYSLPTKESEDSNYFTYVCTGWTPNLNNVECEAHYYPIFSKHYYEYSIEYYYGYDFDGSQQIGDAGDLITTKTYHYYDSIEGFEFSHTYSDFRNLYTFSQWDKILVGENVNDIFNQFSNYVLKVNALYDTEIIYYKISWVDGNGNEIYNESYTYQETPTYNEELYGIPTKLQDNYYTYTFAYWDKQIEPVTKDEVYTATFNSIIRLYNITWVDGNDNVIYVDKLPYDSVITYNINKYGIPTKSKTEFYKYVFDKWENYEVGQKVTGDQTFYSTYLLYNTIKIVNENLQLIDVSNLPTINNAVVDISDLQDNSSLEIKFSNSTLIFDNNAMKFFKDSHKKCAEIIVNLNYDNTENKKFKQEFSFTISIILDNESINNLNGDYSVIINCQTKDSYGLWQNLDGEYQEVAHESVGDSLKFTTNKTGEFICGVKISKSNVGRNILIVVFVVLAIATISITITLVIKKKKFTN